MGGPTLYVAQVRHRGRQRPRAEGGICTRSLRFPPPLLAALTLALAVGCVGYKAEAFAELLDVLIHLAAAEFHLLRELCLG